MASSSMDSVNIVYRIKLDEDNTEIFEFELDGKTFSLVADEVSDPPQWTQLSFKQCPHCPLVVQKHSHCPLALRLCDIVERFHDTRSIDEVELEVVTEERRIVQTLAIQRAIASMLDLILPVCGCPITAYMKPLARFHLPLASVDETVFRVTGMYLLAEYFLNHTSKGGSIKFDGLNDIYKNLHILNQAVSSRLQAATQSDSLINAISLFDTYSILVPVLLESQLAEIRVFYESYLPLPQPAPALANHLDKTETVGSEPIVPIGTELRDIDGRPTRMKEGASVNEPKTNEKAHAEESADQKQRLIHDLLSRSASNLALEPQEDDKNDAFQSSAEGARSGEPQSTKAVFKLPDD